MLEVGEICAANALLLGWVEEATRETRWHAKAQKELSTVRKSPSRTK